MSSTPFLHEQSDFKDLIQAISDAEGILPQLIEKDDDFDISSNEAFTLRDPEIRKRYADRYTNSSGLYFRGQPPFDSLVDRIQEYATKL